MSREADELLQRLIAGLNAPTDADALLRPTEPPAWLQHAPVLFGPGGRPEGVWGLYERECGDLSEITEESVQDLLELQLIYAGELGETVLRIPVAIAQHMARRWEAERDGRPIREARRPRKSWRNRRWEQTAVEQVRLLQRQLMKTQRLDAEEALERARTETGRHYYVSANTLKSWEEHPTRRRRK